MKEKFTLKSLRESKRLDVVFLARQFEVPEEQILMVEKNSNEISYVLLDKYLRFFRITYDEIYFEAFYEDENDGERQDQSVLGRKDLVKLRKENSRFILAYFFVKARAWKNNRFFLYGYIFAVFLPAIMGLFVFRELPFNSYGYFYSWPATFAAALIVFFLGKNIERNYLVKNQRAYFELLEKYFPQITYLFLPALCAGAIVYAVTFTQSNPYFLTNCLAMIPLTFNAVSIGFLLLLIFLPIIVLNFPIKSTIKKLYPLSAIALWLIFQFISPLWDLLYIREENFGIFFVNSCLFLLVAWFLYLLFSYRLHLFYTLKLGLRRKQIRPVKKIEPIFLYLLAITFIYGVFLAIVYQLAGQQVIFSSKDIFVFLPFFFVFFLFVCLFFVLWRQGRRIAEVTKLL